MRRNYAKIIHVRSEKNTQCPKTICQKECFLTTDKRFAKVDDTMKIHVNNLPDDDIEYIVTRYRDGEFWYYGSYESKDRAEHVAKEIDGIIGERT